VSTVRRHAANMFSSLSVRNYRIFFLVQLISVSGTWMQQVAQAWLVLKLTGSGVALGITAALQFLPTLLFASFGGLTADRTDKRKLLMITQLTSGLLALLLAALTLSGRVQLWMVWGLAFSLGMVSSFDNPTRQSFVVEMVGRERLTNAVSLNSAVFTSARVVGPALAGVLIALVGTGWCFLYNGLSYLPVVAGLALMRPSELFRSEPLRRSRGQLVEGLRYAWSHPGLRTPLLMMAVIGTLSLNFSVILPLMATEVFHGGSSAFGLLFSTMGVGALMGALLSAARSSPTQRLLATAAVAFGALMTAAAVMPNFPLEIAALLPMGLFMVTLQATANSLLQLNAQPSFRGRIMALYVTVFIGTTPIGGPIVGFIAEHFGARTAMAVGGLAALLTGTAALALLRARLTRSQREPAERRLAAGGSGWS